MKQPERQIHNSIMEYLSTLSGYTFFTFDNKGSYDPTKKIFRKLKRKWERTDIKPLDIVGYSHRTGKIIWLEVKRPKPNKTYPDKGQRAFIKHCGETNAFARVVRSIDDAIEAIKEFEQ